MRIVAGTALAGVVAVFVLVSAAAAVGAPTWGAPVQLSPSDGEPVVAANARSDEVVGLQGLNSGMFGVISRSGASGPWSAPAVFSTAHGPDAAVAVDVSGDAFSLFETPSGSLQVSDRVGPSGGWQDPVTLNSQQPLYPFGEQLALGAGGSVAVVTTTCCPIDSVQATVRAAGAPLWSPLVALSSGSVKLSSASIALDAAGNAVAAWIESPGTAKASFRPAATGAWGPPLVLGKATDRDFVDTRVAFDTAGNATATWTGFQTSDQFLKSSVVSSAYRPFGGEWGPAVSITAPAASVDFLSLAVVPSGEALAVWESRDCEGCYATVQGAARPASSVAWQSPTNISLEGASGIVGFATDSAGNAVATWTLGGTVQAALRAAANGVWQPPASLGSGNRPAVAIGATGRALAVWNQYNDPVGFESSDLDPSGPIISSLKVPASATARVASSFAIQAVPWASPLRGAPVWQFGDGTSATGAVVSHVYAKSGRYTVSVSQADATGTSTATAPITNVAPSLHSLSQPSIRGVARVGHSLLCLTGIWTGTSPIHYSYTWLRNRLPIAGATHRRYKLRQLDQGTRIACRVKASNLARTVSKTARPVSVRG
jgi:hypothetical protein